MKELWLAITFASILFTGCYSYQAVKPDEGQRLLDSDSAAIQVTTVSGSVIDLDAGHYITVREPEEFTYAVGVLRWTAMAIPSPFHGKVDAKSFWKTDTTLWLSENTLITGPIYTFITRSGAAIRAPEANVLFVKKSDGAGLWCTGTMLTKGGNVPFTGRIALEDIESVKKREISYWRTIPLVVGSAALVAGVIAMAAFAESWNHGWGNWGR